MTSEKNYTCHRKYYSLEFSSFVRAKECHSFIAFIVCRAWIQIAAVPMLVHLVFIILCFHRRFRCRMSPGRVRRRRYHRFRFGQSIINMLCLYEPSEFGQPNRIREL